MSDVVLPPLEPPGAVFTDAELAALLTPIPGDNPSGESLRYDGTYDSIRDARREDDSRLPQGIWETDLKRGEWADVRALCVEALSTRSKDLQVAVWLLEALIRLHGFAGIGPGLRLIRELVDGFWDTMHPQIEDDDLDARAAPIAWVNERLQTSIVLLPITRSARFEATMYCWQDWDSAMRLENMARRDPAAATQMETEGTVSRAKFLASVSLTPRGFYARLTDQLADAMEATQMLDATLDTRFGRQNPGLVRFRTSLQKIHDLAVKFLAERGGRAAGGKAEGGKAKQATAPVPAAIDDGAQDAGNTTEVVMGPMRVNSRDQAYQMLAVAADYLMRTEPHSPTPYLVMRAVSWGRMSLSQLLAHFMKESADLNSVMQLLAIDPADAENMSAMSFGIGGVAGEDYGYGADAAGDEEDDDDY